MTLLWDTRGAVWLAGWALVALAFVVMWLVEVRQNDASLVDATWAAGLGLLAAFDALASPGWPPRRVALAIVVGAWSLRLAFYIARRHASSGEEDARYRELRDSRPDTAHRFFFVFYQAQGLLAAVLSVPFLLIAFDPEPGFRLLELAGVSVSALGLVGESVADAQLASHRANPENRGRTCRSGLWRYSRHPNYFFEWILWCGFGVAALGAPWGFLGLGSPLILLYLIVCVTGIPPAEARALRSRGRDYESYQEQTSAFVPWFPRREATT